jgi:hypothetical protein
MAEGYRRENARLGWLVRDGHPQGSSGHGDAVSNDALGSAARQAFSVGEALDWRSYDPYDILLSPYLGRAFDGPRLLARALLQLGKLTGQRARRWPRVPEHEEAKALADFLQAAVLLAQSGESWAAEYVPTLSQRLRAQGTATSGGRGWGNNFPWVSRFDRIGIGEPNIYTTTAACRALLDAYELEERAEALGAAIEGARFMLDDLGFLQQGGRLWLRYAARSTGRIVNVQASSASLFARLFRHHREPSVLEAADRAAEAVVASQHADGSWTYSEDPRGAFVDGFHTGFTLQGLQEYVESRGHDAVSGAAAAIDTGFSYFKNHLMTPKGLPRGFADDHVSLDGQNVAQCIQTLLVCGEDSDVSTAVRLWELGFSGLQLDEPGARSLRWAVGPFVLSTAYLLRS